MIILPNNVAVCGRTHHVEWCRASGLVHDQWSAANLTRHLNPGDIVIEGGAHIGTLTRAMLDVGAIVFACEPNPEAVECLQHNCIHPNLGIRHVALSDAIGTTRLTVDTMNAGQSFCGSGEHEVETTTIDRLVVETLPVRLIKLDIEGFELRALKGARRTIETHHPILNIEVNEGALQRAGTSRAELFAYLDSIGYQWSRLQRDMRDDDPQYDIEAMHR